MVLILDFEVVKDDLGRGGQFELEQKLQTQEESLDQNEVFHLLAHLDDFIDVVQCLSVLLSLEAHDCQVVEKHRVALYNLIVLVHVSHRNWRREFVALHLLLRLLLLRSLLVQRHYPYSVSYSFSQPSDDWKLRRLQWAFRRLRQPPLSLLRGL